MKPSCRVVSASLVLALAVFATSARAASAGPHFTLSPTTGSYTLDSTFDVTLGVDTEGQKSTMYDISMTYDQSKLELLTVTSLPNSVWDQVGGFSFSPIINNSQGKFQTAILGNSQNIYEEKIVTGPLLKLTFKAKAVGTGALNFVCQQGSDTDSNIIYIDANRVNNDVITCSSNSSGVYTITNASSGTSATSTPVPTSATSTTSVSTSTPTAATLPKTGTTEVTLALVLVGLVGVIGGAFGVLRL